MTQAAVKKETEMTDIESVRVIGVVKWFDAAKGYGFVVPGNASDDALSGDVMIHISVLRQYGESRADEGASIVLDAVQGDRGWQAVNVLEMEKPRPPVRETELSGEYFRVIVKWFDKTKGYGFVRRADLDEDIFIHAVVARANGIESIEPGEEFDAAIDSGSKGLFVAAAKLITNDDDQACE